MPTVRMDLVVQVTDLSYSSQVSESNRPGSGTVLQNFSSNRYSQHPDLHLPMRYEIELGREQDCSLGNTGNTLWLKMR